MEQVREASLGDAYLASQEATGGLNWSVSDSRTLGRGLRVRHPAVRGRVPSGLAAHPCLRRQRRRKDVQLAPRTAAEGHPTHADDLSAPRGALPLLPRPGRRSRRRPGCPSTLASRTLSPSNEAASGSRNTRAPCSSIISSSSAGAENDTKLEVRLRPGRRPSVDGDGFRDP